MSKITVSHRALIAVPRCKKTESLKTCKEDTEEAHVLEGLDQEGDFELLMSDLANLSPSEIIGEGPIEEPRQFDEF